jgi:hypothetical protein
VIPSAMIHGCVSCTHVKRYHSDLIQEGAALGVGTGIASVSDGTVPPAGGVGDTTANPLPLPANLPSVLAQQEAPPNVVSVPARHDIPNLGPLSWQSGTGPAD